MHRFLLLLLLLVPVQGLAFEQTIETNHLVVVAASGGQLSEEQFRQLAARAEELTEQLLAFWSAESRIEQLGKIRVKFEPPNSVYYGAQAFWEQGGKNRTVIVFGTRRGPQELAHKLTHAIFPSSDKLVRNMMGIPSEARFGTMDSFPMCGLDMDDWVLALRDAGAYRPLSELTPDNEAWGQTMGRYGLLIVTNERRQHISYAEAGSFGAYLLRTYGIPRVKRFYRVTNDSRRRPWAEVFGHPLDELEKDWMAQLESARADRSSGIAAAFRLQGMRGGAMCPPRTGD